MGVEVLHLPLWFLMPLHKRKSAVWKKRKTEFAQRAESMYRRVLQSRLKCEVYGMRR